MENRLEEVLKEQGRKKGWLAETADVSGATIRSILYNPNYDPPLSIARKVAKALDVTIDDIWPCH